LALLGVLGVPLAALAYWPMFSSFRFYDDEGNWTIALRSYHLHGSLYHHTYSQCGPLYYQLLSGFFSLTGLTVDLDTARAVTLGVWVLTAVLVGWATYLLTVRIGIGLLGMLASFVLLSALQAEPLEPAGLACLLVAILLLGIVALGRRRERLGMAVVGAAVAALVLTKVNVGIFAGAAALYGLAVCWGNDRCRRARQVAGAVILVAVPLALTMELLGLRWVQRFVAFELLAYASIAVAVGVVVGGWGGAPRVEGADPGRSATVIHPVGAAWFAGAAAVLTAAVAVGALTNGTSLGVLVSGALLAQRHEPTLFSSLLPLSNLNELWAVVGLFGAVGYAVMRKGSHSLSVPAWLPAGGRIVAGSWMCLTVAGGVHPQVAILGGPASFVNALPLTWLVITPPPPSRGRDAPLGPPIRVLVAALAALLTLQVFPVDGSQLAWSGLGLVVAGAVIISDGLHCLAPSSALGPGTVPGLGPHRGAALPAVLVAVLVIGNLVPTAWQWRHIYQRRIPTGLAGAHRVRWPPAEVGVEQQVTAALRSECTTFVSLPGLNKFYFFTGQAPPTDLNTTQWMYLQGRSVQQKVVDALEGVPRACALENDTVLGFWQQGKPLPSSSPLQGYIRTHFMVTAHYGDFTILVRPHASPSPPLPATGVVTVLPR
jgi:hypothetical protein